MMDQEIVLHATLADISKETDVIQHVQMDIMEIMETECAIHVIQVAVYVLDQMIINVQDAKKDSFYLEPNVNHHVLTVSMEKQIPIDVKNVILIV